MHKFYSVAQAVGQSPLWTDTLTALSSVAIAVATIAGVILALRQLKESLRHADQHRASMLEQQHLSRVQQQNAIVMQLWQNFDEVLDRQTTRDDIRRFIAWGDAFRADDRFRTWIQFFAKGHAFDRAKGQQMLSDPNPLMRDFFDTNNNGFGIEDITRVRGSLNRFFNVVEQASVAYLHKIGNTSVMDECMLPTLKAYSMEMRDYIQEMRKLEPETWEPIVQLCLPPDSDERHPSSQHVEPVVQSLSTDNDADAVTKPR